ncbi:hypothetical protein GWI33_005462, partial [Rhynchophorus ferrugineus]
SKEHDKLSEEEREMGLWFERMTYQVVALVLTWKLECTETE